MGRRFKSGPRYWTEDLRAEAVKLTRRRLAVRPSSPGNAVVYSDTRGRTTLPTAAFMPRKRNPVPSYLRHKPSGQAYVALTTPEGGKRFVYLGVYGSDESRREYTRVVAELGVNTQPAPAAGNILSVNELLQRFKTHVERH